MYTVIICDVIMHNVFMQAVVVQAVMMYAMIAEQYIYFLPGASSSVADKVSCV